HAPRVTLTPAPGRLRVSKSHSHLRVGDLRRWHRACLTWRPGDSTVASSLRRSLVGVGVTVLALVSAPTQRSWAQANDETTEGADLSRLEWPITLILIGAIAMLLLLALIAKMLDLRLKRDGEVVAVKGVMSDALGGDPELFDLPLTMTVRVPLWRGSPVTIRV